MKKYNWFEIYAKNSILRKRYLKEKWIKVYFYGIARLILLYSEINRCKGHQNVAVYFTKNQKKSVSRFCHYPTLNLSLEHISKVNIFATALTAFVYFPYFIIKIDFNFSINKLRAQFAKIQCIYLLKRRFSFSRLVISSNLTPQERSFIEGIKKNSPKTWVWLIPHGAWMKSYPSICYEDVVVVESINAYNFYKSQNIGKVILNKSPLKPSVFINDKLPYGLSINGNTSNEKLEELLASIKTSVLVKFHPSMPRKNIELQHHLEFKGSLDDFFKSIRMHLCGNSTMHLDAIKHGVLTKFVDIDHLDDDYTFLSSGLVSVFSNSNIINIENLRKIQRNIYENEY